MTRTPKVRVHYAHVARVPHTCPVCQRLIEVATNTDDGDASGPGPGSFTFCISCGHASVFTPDMVLRRLTSDETRRACHVQLFLRTYASMASRRRAYRVAHRIAED